MQIKPKKCFLSHLTAFEKRCPSKLWLALSLLWGLALYPAFINGIAILWSIILWALLILYMRKQLSDVAPEAALSAVNRKKSRNNGRYYLWGECLRVICVFMAIFIVCLLTMYLLNSNGAFVNFQGLVSFRENVSLHMDKIDLMGSLDQRALNLVFHENIRFSEETFTDIQETSMQYTALWMFNLIFFSFVSFFFIGILWKSLVNQYALHYHDLSSSHFASLFITLITYLMLYLIWSNYSVIAIDILELWNSDVELTNFFLLRYLILQLSVSTVLLIIIAGYPAAMSNLGKMYK